jgi:hypothetical protein
MATFSRIVRFSHNNELAVGVIVSLYRTDNGEKAFIGDEITDSNGFVEFTSVDPAGEYEITARHNVGETLYNALNQPFLSAGFDPATISPNFWVKSDESGLFTFRGETDFVSSTGAKSPATLALTQATEGNQPELVNNYIQFLKANGTHLLGTTSSANFLTGASATYAFSIAAIDYVQEDNSAIFSITNGNNQFAIFRTTGDLQFRHNSTTLATFPSTSGDKIFSIRGDHANNYIEVRFNNETPVVIDDFVPGGAVASRMCLGAYTGGGVSSTYKCPEMVLSPEYPDTSTFESLHTYMMRHFT